MDELSQQILTHFSLARSTDHIPSLVELIGVAVQLVERRPLSGSQKMELVKGVIPLVIAQLPLPEVSKSGLQASVFLVEDIAETILTVIEADQTLNSYWLRLWRCCSRKALNINFPLL